MNDFAINGASPARQSRFAPLWNCYFSSGLISQRNPLRPGNASALTTKMYGNRGDSLLDGLNLEISNRLTFVRRPGSSVYNSQTFPTIDNFYDFRVFDSNAESVKVIADTSDTVYDATGPSTKSVVYSKSPNSGQVYFQSVGNTLYFGDNFDQKKWVQSAEVWAPRQSFTVDQFIVDPNNNIQKVQSSGTSGAAQPMWATIVGATTGDGFVTWKNLGSATQNWGITAPTTAPTVTLPNTDRYWKPNSPLGVYYSILDPNNNIEVLVSPPGPGINTGSVEPTWPIPGVLTSDGGVQWFNVGPIISWLPNTDFNYPACIQDTNGNLQYIGTKLGNSGTVPPTWNTTLGGGTTDGGITWVMAGPGYVVNTGAYQYAYSYHGFNGGVSTASPLATVSANTLSASSTYTASLAGNKSTDQQVDEIWIWRTVQGGSILLLLDTIPVPGGFSPWTYVDNTPDTGLNNLIVAPIADSNDPPPVGLTKMTYHLNRIWGVVNNSVYFSGGPDTTTGNGNESFPPANVLVFPDTVMRLFASSQGLFVFTLSDVYVIQGTTTSSFFSVQFCAGLGLPNYNAFAINGSTPYFFTSDSQIVALDMTGAVVEVGFNIGDQFQKPNWDPSTVRVTYHISGSTDKGLYVSDFSTGWFRLYPTPAPENGQTWTPFAGIVGGCGIVQSVQTAPGKRNLLIGPKVGATGPILKRDDTVFTDNGHPYDAFGLLGSIVMAQPGQLAEILFMTFDSVAIGSRPTVSVQLDEIAPFSAGLFETLPNHVQDPTELTPSVSMFSDRYYLSQTQQPALGRSMQIRLDWGNDTVQNELLSMTIFGGYSSEL